MSYTLKVTTHGLSQMRGETALNQFGTLNLES
jgi:hypothetical protein